MELKRITLINFKGAKAFTLDINGKNVNVYGDNGTGKSTIYDGFLWCLFGKDSRGQADFDIKPLDKNNNPIHNLESTVEVLLGGTTFTRTYKEVYTKKRGSARDEFTGHTTDYSINGVPVDKKTYDNNVSAILPDKTFRLLTTPDYFSSLKWQDRRIMLMDSFTNDITENIVIAANKDLQPLTALLGNHKVDEYKSIINSQIKKLNDELKTIPVRIDEITKGLPEPVTQNYDISLINENIRKANTRLAQTKAGSGGAEFALALANAEADLIRYETEQERIYNESNASLRDRFMSVNNEKAQLNKQVTRIYSDINSDRQNLSFYEKEINQLRGELIERKAQQFTGSTSCPACGQDLQEDRIHEALSKYNSKKAQGLEVIIERGTSLKNKIESLNKRISQQEQEAKDIENKLSELNAIDAPVIQPFTLNRTAPAYLELSDKVNHFKQEINNLSSKQSERIAQIEGEIQEYQIKLNEITTLEQKNRQYEAGLARIKELEDKETELATSFELKQHSVLLIEEFIKTKVSLVTDKINSKFSLVKFKLFEEQINGGINECCEITYNGVPWRSLNNGARINAGLDIINTIGRATESDAPPIFIDNAESVTNIISTDGQQIRLIVSEIDKKLRIETIETQNNTPDLELAGGLF